MTGRLLQRYRLFEEVGQGGMAVVYRGVDESLEREVAVKVLHPHLAARVEHRRRLAREAKAVARLHHPNILEIYDFSGEESPEAYIVTELIKGRTLRMFAQAHPFDPPELAAACVHELAGALAHAHAQNIIHRDLKPDNVMVREDGPQPLLKLMDFGIAQIVDRDERMTVTGSLIGSPAHMAPEIIDGHEADVRSDVFSLGTILYWLATGQLPFEAPSPGALLKRILSGDYADPRELRPAISDALAKVIAQSLATDPNERIPTALAFRELLRASLSDSGFERPAELLSRFLRAPAEVSRETRHEVVTQLMAQGAAAATARKTAKALTAYARIIAVVPGTPEAGAAREAIDRLKSRTRWRRRGLVAASLGVLGLTAALVSSQLDRGPDAPAAVVDPASPDVRWVPTPATTGTPETPSNAADRTMTPVVPPGTVRSAKTRERAATEPFSRTVSKAFEHPAPPVAAPAGEPAHVLIQVLPFARIAVDGRVVAETRTWDGELPAGPHRIELTHDCCTPMTVDTTLAAGERKVLREKLVPRDAGLRLRVSGPPDVGIMIDDTFEKYLSELAGAPVVVKMAKDLEGNRQYDREVRIRLFAKGYRDFVTPVRVHAGEARTLDVTMEPQG